ncbi:hypothetical protein ACWWU7_13895 [Stenotrophomonas sp. SM006]|uniref:hypothetical protein n=1 Tax=Stenotrophomonas TaxID=40323 RepID=UPI0010439B61|nr:hypothetical protein [Stenotrophomonas sp. ASS1]EKT4087850.1 hypothetical protein [Stenotrophomonas maltophilia]NED65519.1 hypothetical protein [Streptomyces sp. SID10244]QBL42224.1 hypothetical protein MG068_17550 [Stenotrophomonas sp. ASS1]
MITTFTPVRFVQGTSQEVPWFHQLHVAVVVPPEVVVDIVVPSGQEQTTATCWLETPLEPVMLAVTTTQFGACAAPLMNSISLDLIVRMSIPFVCVC